MALPEVVSTAKWLGARLPLLALLELENVGEALIHVIVVESKPPPARTP